MASGGRRTAAGKASVSRPRGHGVRMAVALTAGATVGALLVWLARPAPPVAVPAASPPVAASPPPAPAPAVPDEAFAPPPVRGDAVEEAPAPAPETASAWLDPDGEPTRALARAALAAAIERHDPSLVLSREELDAATDALWTLREARLELARLGDDPAQARRRAALVEAIGRATADFTYHVEMSPDALTALDAGEAGLDAPPPTTD